MADRVEDVEVAVGGRGGVVVDERFGVDQVAEAALGGTGAVDRFEQGAGGAEDLDRLGGGVGDVEVPDGGGLGAGAGEAREGDPVVGGAGVFADPGRDLAGVDRGRVFGDVGAVGYVEVAAGGVEGEAGGRFGARFGGAWVDQGAFARHEFRGGIGEHVVVKAIEVEIAA